MQFALSAGLQIRQGKRILQLTHQTPDGQVVFEDLVTRLPAVFKRSDLIKDIWAGKTEVVWSDDEAAEEGETTSSKVRPSRRVTDYSSLPEKDRKLLEYRLSYVRAVGRSRVSRGQRAKIQKVIEKVAASLQDKSPPSTSTVMSWLRCFHANYLDPSSLLSGNRARKQTLRSDPRVEEIVWKVLRTEYFTRAKNSARHAYRELRRQLKISVLNGELKATQESVSYATFCRRIEGVELYHRLATRVGEGYARAQCRVAFPGAVPSYPMERMEIDHTPLNWIVICDKTGLPLGRPTLTLAIDGATSYPLGFYVSFYGPGVASVGGVLRNATQPKDELVAAAGLKTPWLAQGLPDLMVVDNGLEFHSHSFNAIALSLGVDVMYCRVRTPWLKPKVERFFESLNVLTLERGRISKVVANVSRIDPDRDALVTFSEFVKGLLKFVVEVFPHQYNWRKMATPFELYQEGIERIPPAVFPASMEEFRLASGMSKQLMLGKGGIELEGIPYGSYAFKDIVNKYGHGRVLCKWDPDNLSELYFQHPHEGRWHVASSRWPHYTTGLSYNQHRLIKRFSAANYRDSGGEDALHRAQQELHDYWKGIVGKRSRSDNQLAGRLSGLTSSNVFQDPPPKATQAGPVHESRIVLPAELPFTRDAIPDFEAFTA